MATMIISSNPGQDVTVTLALPATNPEAGSVSCSFTFQTTKGLLGPSSNPTDQSGFANSTQDLFAVTVEPATKAAFVHFFLTSAKGNVVFANDVDARVAKLLSLPWKDDAKGFLRVETIQGRKVKLSTTDFAHANAARDAAEHRRVTQETELKTRETAVAGAEAKIAEAENKATKAQTDLLKLQNEKAELERELDASRNEIASLQKRMGEAGPAATPSQNPHTASKPEQQPTTSGPSVQITQEPVEEGTPSPPPQQKRRKTAPSKAPEVAGSLGTISYSSAKAFATFTPSPQYP